MIRVLHVVGKMHYGGMETLIMNVYRHINREKVQFDFLVHYDEPGEYDEEIRALGGKIFVMPKTVPQNYFRYQKALRAFFTEHQEYKIIHGHLQSVAFLYHKIAKQTGDRCCITHSHNTGYEKDLKGIMGYHTALLAQKYTDVFFGCSMDACKVFFPKATAQNKPMTIIKNGIDSAKYLFDENVRTHVRQELGAEDRLIIGHTGRFSKQKNHEFLIRVFKEIVKKRPDSLLLLVGEGPLKEQISHQVQELSLADQVKFLGARGDVNQILQAMDVFVLPSLFEGLGIVLIEAQAAGLKCFTSTGVPEDARVTDLLNYLSLEQSPEYWADQILKSLPYERRNTQREIVSSGYDISDTAQQLEEFYLSAAQ